MIEFKGNPKITTIVLHHTAVSRSAQPTQTTEVNNYHKGKWNYISELGYYGGYNFIVEPTGKRTQYRKVGEETIANVGMNCDVPSRCTAISYCMAGDFRVEKPTDLQVSDFRQFIAELKKTYPNVLIKQHKDVQTGRTCAELSDSELDKITAQDITKDQYIAQLEGENKKLSSMVTQLISIITKLINK